MVPIPTFKEALKPTNRPTTVCADGRRFQKTAQNAPRGVTQDDFRSFHEQQHTHPSDPDDQQPQSEEMNTGNQTPKEEEIAGDEDTPTQPHGTQENNEDRTTTVQTPRYAKYNVQTIEEEGEIGELHQQEPMKSEVIFGPNQEKVSQDSLRTMASVCTV